MPNVFIGVCVGLQSMIVLFTNEKTTGNDMRETTGNDRKQSQMT